MSASEFVGQVFDGKYRLERPLGEGGMGAVYLATHLGTERTVALKVIASRFGDQPEFVERFRREARAAGRLRHPNVVDVTDFGLAKVEGRELAYLVMEYLDGCSLGEVLQDEGPLPLGWVVEILDQACSAVHEAHQQGIVHRDLKPDNLWLEPDRRGGYTVKVLDFGLAKLAEAASRPVTPGPLPLSAGVPLAPTLAGLALEAQETQVQPQSAPATTAVGSSTAGSDLTRAGAVLGTPAYMSPEQCRGDALDARSDIYSLGVLAYRMVSGVLPFSGDTPSLVQKHLTESPPRLRGGRGGVPRPVAEMIAQALEKDPARRPPSAAAFAAALRARTGSRSAFRRQVRDVLADRYRQLLWISALASGPLFLVSLGLLLGALAPWSRTSLFWAAAAATARLLLLLTWLVAVLGTSALSEPVVLQALVAPRRPTLLRPLLAEFRGRLAPYALTVAPMLVLATGLFLPGFLPRRFGLAGLGLVLLGALWLLLTLDSFRFVAPVVMMEGLVGKAARSRSRHLTKRWRRELPSLRGLGQGSLLVLLMLIVGIGTSMLLRGPFALFGLGTIWALLAPLQSLLLPQFATTSALIYFRVREADGESLPDILAQFESRVLPPAPWQARVRDRLRAEIQSRRS